MYFCFQDCFDFDETDRERARTYFYHHAAARLGDIYYRAREAAKAKVGTDTIADCLYRGKPPYLKQSLWERLITDTWQQAEWKKKQQQEKAARNTKVGGGDGVEGQSSRHRGGSRPFVATAKIVVSIFVSIIN